MDKLKIGKNIFYFFENKKEACLYAAEKIKRIALGSLKRKRKFSFAFSGGKTANILYRYLREVKNFPWERTDVFMVDERFIGYRSKNSNFGNLNRHLLKKIAMPEKNIHPVPVKGKIRHCALLYEKILKYFFKKKRGFPEFDIIILGLGKDGHIASLFPNSKLLNEKNKWVLFTPPKNGFMRITLSLPLINKAKHILFLILGSEKKDILNRLIKLKRKGAITKNLPATLVNKRKGNIIYISDKLAKPIICSTVLI